MSEASLGGVTVRRRLFTVDSLLAPDDVSSCSSKADAVSVQGQSSKKSDIMDEECEHFSSAKVYATIYYYFEQLGLIVGLHIMFSKVYNAETETVISLLNDYFSSADNIDNDSLCTYLN
jgi:hypothetical protein